MNTGVFGGEEQRGPIRAGIFEFPEATVGD